MAKEGAHVQFTHECFLLEAPSKNGMSAFLQYIVAIGIAIVVTPIVIAHLYAVSSGSCTLPIRCHSRLLHRAGIKSPAAALMSKELLVALRGQHYVAGSMLSSLAGRRWASRHAKGPLEFCGIPSA